MARVGKSQAFELIQLYVTSGHKRQQGTNKVNQAGGRGEQVAVN